MARLSFVRVEGLTGRAASLMINFDEGLNVIWGSNGSGKTSLLKILHSAMTGDTAPLLRISFTSAEVGFTTDLGRTIVRRIKRRVPHAPALLEYPDGIEYELYRDPDMAKYELMEDARALRWDTLDGDIQEYLPHRYLPISRIFDFRNRHGRPSRGGLSEVLDEVEYDRIFAEQIQSLWSEFHAQALSHTRAAQQDAINRILGAALAGDEYIDPDERHQEVPIDDTRRLVQTFFKANRGLSRHVNVKKVISEFETDPLMNRVVRTVSAVQKQIEEALAPERRFAETLNALYSGTKFIDISGPRRLSVKLGHDDVQIPIESLASGEKQVMRILLETLVAGSSPVLVDEPEISLHVDWQSRLLEMMRYINPRAQLIVASHSPEVVGSSWDRGLVIES